jgi:hypothetical protein
VSIQHATPASIYLALGEYLDDDTPELISVHIIHEVEYPEDGSRVQFYRASIHIYEPQWAAWLEYAGFTRDDVTTEGRNDESNTESVTAGDGITLFTIVSKSVGDGAA